jgi:hypothetical protein
LSWKHLPCFNWVQIRPSLLKLQVEFKFCRFLLQKKVAVWLGTQNLPNLFIYSVLGTLGTMNNYFDTNPMPIHKQVYYNSYNIYIYIYNLYWSSNLIKGYIICLDLYIFNMYWEEIWESFWCPQCAPIQFPTG